jgi:hypothetical protein
VTVRLLTSLAVLLLCVDPADAQPIPRVDPGWGIDTAMTAWTELSWHRDDRLQGCAGVVRPDVSLDSILEGNGPDAGWRPAGAILLDMVHESGGWAAVRRLLTGGRSNEELHAIVEELLGAPWSRIGAIWKAKALSPGA